MVQSKGRAVSRLLESFAADEGFRLGEDSSFSDEDEERKVSSNSRTPLGEQSFYNVLYCLTMPFKYDQITDDLLAYCFILQYTVKGFI